jgi:predicted SnoaL-like aldol condensation-catalyzing enzyme
MLDRKRFLSLAGILSLTAAGATASAATVAPGLADFCTLFYGRKQVRAAFERHVAADYIQHSSGMAHGREAAIRLLEPMFARPHFSATPVGTLSQGALSMVMLDVRMGTDIRAAVVDIFRWQNGLIQEHWDFKQELTADQARSYFDRLHA